MKLAVMQPYFFPYLGYFQLIHAVDKFVVYDDVNYITRGWVNRNRILASGKDKMVTLPLRGASQNKKINEIEVLLDTKWLKKTSRTLDMAYSKAPYFSQVRDLVMVVLESGIGNLSGFLSNGISLVAGYLGVTTKIIPTSTCYGNVGLARQDRLIDICKQERAEEYINSLGGLELYSKEEFDNQGIQLGFLKPHLLEYAQFSEEFIPGLSIIDVMMHNSTDDIIAMINDYELA